MNYKVFKIDDSDTWPKLNCPVLVWKKNIDWPQIYQWDPNGHCFLNDYDTYYPNKCLYAYIGYRPYVKKELHPKKCTNEASCCEEDDGYCLYAGYCEYQKEEIEYAIAMEKIWDFY